MEGIFYYQLEEWCYINKESKESRMPNIYFNIIFGKTEQCVCFNISFCSSTSSQKVSLFLVSIFIFVCPEEWRYVPKLLCSVWSLYSGFPTSKAQNWKNIFYIREGFHFGGEGGPPKFLKIFSIKGGRRGVLLLLNVTCSVIPDILSSTSFKLQTSPSSSASLRLLLMNLTNNRWIIISHVWYWPESEREKSRLTCG